ncbi:hypothetical protein MYX65_07255 [Acidobacteria bacterium AH-259-L09]|nr:hypothetical protein [Acidobacteria bacterium AH-259-L09]
MDEQSHRGRVLAVVILSLFCFNLGGQAEEKKDLDFRTEALTEQLEEYFSDRVLIFRQPGIEGHKITFDSQGRLLGKPRQGQKSGYLAISFIDLQVEPERLTILGETVQIRTKGKKRIYVRDPQKVNLVTCTVLMDTPVEKFTFVKAISIFFRIFFGQDELEKIDLTC